MILISFEKLSKGEKSFVKNAIFDISSVFREHYLPTPELGDKNQYQKIIPPLCTNNFKRNFHGILPYLKEISPKKSILFKTSKSVDPLTPLTLIYDSVTLPIMCKCMYRKLSRTSTH